LWYEGWENVDLYLGDYSHLDGPYLDNLSMVRVLVEEIDTGGPEELPPNQLHLENLDPGIHILSVRVKDTDGVWSEDYEVEFRVNANPVAVIDSITSVSYRQENPRYTDVDLQAHGEDDIGIVMCEWTLDYLDSSIYGLDIPSQNWSTEPPCSQFGLRNLTAGNYTFALRVLDTDGVWSEWVSHPPFYVDDGDEIGFETDKYPLDNTQWYDSDNDGCGDNEMGTNGDVFPNDPTECFDTDGDGIGDNSDRFPTINNLYLYGGSTVTVALIGAALAELGARRSVPGLIEALEQLNSSGISDNAINEAIEDLESSEGMMFFSEDRANAMSLVEKYADIQSNATTSMNELEELRNELDALEASGLSNPDILSELDNIEELLSSQVGSDTNSDYWEELKSSSKGRGGK
jgi:hypothetical protein